MSGSATQPAVGLNQILPRLGARRSEGRRQDRL